ncbi:rhamnulokinase [Isoptericola sp. NEAU-Y5]|uniref:Rhamnulokinase n=1 Tax=Isoptericola luteus TaxID=2879484 RepID=A0ABS7ZB27_9MICO|nr:rhamnulokinase family protein [Isoptericola sp. NEAU-Y5]MCA5892261.1 rhamnulokinase [Isoptericola sp. NEAU-Y5]
MTGASAGRRAAGTFAAVDLGATSGRVILGRFGGRDGLRLQHVARFPNDPVRTPDGLHWNLLELYRQVVEGLAAAEREAPGEILGVGIDSWAVDYGLLRGGRLLGLPYHYRDRRTADGVARVHARVDAATLYTRNGLQHLPFTTVFQLASEGPLLGLADRLLLVPDLLAHWLTGAEVAERTNASTTGLLDARTGQWDTALAAELGIPAAILPGLVDPGASLGVLAPDVARLVGRALAVTAVGSHDTASAVVAVPTTDRDVAYVSCGTWGLVGLELDAPVLTEEARLAGFTNERGVDGRTRFLHNVMGLWLLSESIRTWEPGATTAQRSSTLAQLLAEAAHISAPVTLFDVDDPRFLPPGDVPGRIADWCREHDQPVPATRGEYVRSIVESLAQAFADAVRAAASLAGRTVSTIHVVGGGAQNTLLCQATADRSGLPVVAGPVEATAVGNLLVQARADGLVDGGLEDLRALVAAAFTPERYMPR